MANKTTDKMTDKTMEYYASRAKQYGDSSRATMGDDGIREKEIEALVGGFALLSFFNSSRILEVGCGNGYVAGQIAERLGVKIAGIDYCGELIEIAQNRNLENVEFKIGDVLNLEYDDGSFDFVYTERCLINLGSWKNQQRALNEIWRVLKPHGGFLMIEAFTDGLDNLNKARDEMGLEPIKQPFWDLFFDKEEFKRFVKGKFVNALAMDYSGDIHSNFLSTYYYGSRVIYPALIAGRKEVTYNTKFVEFFKYLPPYGNYGPVQLFVLEKVDKFV